MLFCISINIILVNFSPSVTRPVFGNVSVLWFILNLFFFSPHNCNRTKGNKNRFVQLLKFMKILPISCWKHILCNLETSVLIGKRNFSIFYTAQKWRNKHETLALCIRKMLAVHTNDANEMNKNSNRVSLIATPAGGGEFYGDSWEECV